jgi:stage II sporulation protein AA (anti-sigma F factor antagonist)
MPITYIYQHGEMTAQLSGEIDHHGARAVMTGLDAAIRDKLPLRLTLDLSGVTFMDSSGIAVLIRAKRQMDGLGGSVRAVAIPAQPRRVLDAAGLGRLIPLES